MAADGVAAALSAKGIGLQLRPGSPPIPIVPSAVLHDLGNGGDKNWGLGPPYRDLGIRALDAAGADFALGSVGAGRGAMAGLIKGGIGSASLDLGEGLTVGALVAVNSIGSALMPDGKTYWAWAFELGQEFERRRAPRRPMDLSNPAPDESRLMALGRLQAGANTTLAVVACNADLTTVECKRMAMMAQDGIARAVRPAHTPFDGDTIFATSASGCWRSANQTWQRRPDRAHRLRGGGLPVPRHCPRRTLQRSVAASTAQRLMNQAGRQRQHGRADENVQDLPGPRPRKKGRQ